LGNCESWKHLFATKPYIPKIPELLKLIDNSSTLFTELSKRTAHTAFIHGRKEIMNNFKLRLPKVVYPHRRKLKFVPLVDNIVDGIEIYICSGDAGNVVQSCMKKYVESGLFDIWERFAAILKFRWTFIKTNEYVNVISFDARFVAIISTFSAAYACHFVILCAEIFHSKKSLSIGFCYHRILFFFIQVSFFFSSSRNS